ncbi:MAG: HAD family phosphatase [Verrucomicrobia bacterium]|nr:HAD family phosphatase [Verrucomicrobiota bacterium]
MMVRTIFFLLWFFTLFSAPKAVVFDFGGVVATHDPKPIIDYIEQTLGTNAAIDFQGDKLYSALVQGEDFWHSYAHAHDKELPQGWMGGLNKRVKQFVHLTPGIDEIISELKSRGIRVALLTNTTKLRSDFYYREGFYRPFDPVILSWQYNVRKPDPKIYEILLERLDLPAKECIFIDNREENVVGAKKLGIHTILFQSAPQLRRELERYLKG